MNSACLTPIGKILAVAGIIAFALVCLLIALSGAACATNHTQPPLTTQTVAWTNAHPYPSDPDTWNLP